jgi:hypothetical protein
VQSEPPMAKPGFGGGGPPGLGREQCGQLSAQGVEAVAAGRLADGPMRGGELMCWPGLRGVILGKEVETTVSNKEQPCPLDG